MYLVVFESVGDRKIADEIHNPLISRLLRVVGEGCVLLARESLW
ncbi:MAG: hypothetical protein ACC742_03045 [Thermoanaerobaculales bacterium]